MGIAPEMKLVIKRTFLEFVEENAVDGSLRPRSFTDSGVHLTAANEKQESEATAEPCGADGMLVNQSATEELKAFLGLGGAEDLPSSPPAKLPGSPYRRSPMLTPLREEEQPSESPCIWPEAQAADVLAPFTLPQCGMTAWWVPVALDTKPVLQISDMISPPTVDTLQQENYMSQPWWNCVSVGLDTSYMSEASVSTSCSEGQEHQNTTVILRNLPNNYTRSMLLDLLDSEGFALKYDFVYIPVDFSSQAGLGYAFVNLVSPSDALAFWAHFEGFRRWSLPSEKVCTLNWSSPIQGLTAHVERYRNSPVMHEAVPDEWKPVLYFGGERVVFPPPTKAIKAPKIRNNRAAGAI